MKYKKIIFIFLKIDLSIISCIQFKSISYILKNIILLKDIISHITDNKIKNNLFLLFKKIMKGNIIYQFLTWDLFTMSDIQRYSWAKVIIKENLAEHSYYVSVLADLITEDLIKRYPQKEINRLNVLRFALYHDYEEVYTWDIVTPVKYKSDEFRKGLEHLWKILLNEGVKNNFINNEHIWERIRLSNSEYGIKKDKDLENRIVKFADLLQSLSYVVKEVNLWNSYMEIKVKRIIKTMINKYSTSHYFRPYIKDLFEIIKQNKLIKSNIIDIDWEKFLNPTENEISSESLLKNKDIKNKSETS